MRGTPAERGRVRVLSPNSERSTFRFHSVGTPFTTGYTRTSSRPFGYNGPFPDDLPPQWTRGNNKVDASELQGHNRRLSHLFPVFVTEPFQETILEIGSSRPSFVGTRDLPSLHVARVTRSLTRSVPRWRPPTRCVRCSTRWTTRTKALSSRMTSCPPYPTPGSTSLTTRHQDCSKTWTPMVSIDG